MDCRVSCLKQQGWRAALQAKPAQSQRTPRVKVKLPVTSVEQVSNQSAEIQVLI